MGADSDDEEMAAVRAARARRDNPTAVHGSISSGAAGSGSRSSGSPISMEALREKQKRLQREEEERRAVLATQALAHKREEGEEGRENGSSAGPPREERRVQRESDDDVADDDDDGDNDDGRGRPEVVRGKASGRSVSSGASSGERLEPLKGGKGKELALPGVLGEVEVEDEADLVVGLRAAFPIAFGKQEEQIAPLESRHAATKRAGVVVRGNGPVRGKGAGVEGGRGKGMVFKIGGKAGARAGGDVGVATSERQREEEGVGTREERRGREKGAERCESASVGPAHSMDTRESDDGGGGALVGPPRPSSLVERPLSGQMLEGGSEVRGRMVGTGGRGGDAREGRAMITVGQRSNAEREKLKGRKKSKHKVEDGDEEVDDDEDEDPEDEEDEDKEGEGEEGEDEYRVPVSNEVVLQGHTKVVVALAVDPTGSRVLTGSYDYTVRMYDFGGMDARLKSFRELTPFDGHQVRSITWSPTADRFFIATGNAQAKVYDRDGRTLGEFVRGDMYIRDMRNTNGHLSGITCAEWHPNKRNTVVTSSEDGSVRIWDVTNFKKQVQVVKPKLARPGRVPVTVCKWGPGGQTVAAGLNDGSLQVWNVKAGWGSRPDLFVADAHEKGEDVSGLLFSGDGSLLLSRCTDATLKVWDVRKFKQPVHTFSDLPNHYGQTNVAWSPDERLLFTGTSVEKGGRGSEIVFFNRETFEVVRRTGVSETQSVVRVEWHPRLNQIFATVGDKKSGGTHILYDPTFSERGALQCVARAPRKPRPEDVCSAAMAPVIHNPHALPLFREPPSRKRQREKARKDPVQSKRPELPIDGPGHGGRVGQAKGTLLTQYLLREGGLLKETWMEEDPREAILRYAEAAEKDPRIIAPAYATTQPKPVFHESDEEAEED